MKKKENSSTNYVGVGVALGVSFGAAFGAALGNVGLGVALGIAFGAALGAAYQSRKSEDPEGRAVREGQGGDSEGCEEG
jgi:hypothetical protein